MPRKLTISWFLDQRHASAHHMHMTNRRFFIGPIPEGWLLHHRKSWYKAGLKLKNYSSKTVSFSADPVVVRYDDDTTENEPPSSGPEHDTTQNGDSQNHAREEETQTEENHEPNEEGLARSSGGRDVTPSREISKSQNTTPTTDTGTSSTQGRIIAESRQLTYSRCCLILHHGQRSGLECR